MQQLVAAGQDNGDWALGRFAERGWYTQLAEGDAAVHRPDGSLLARIVPGAIAPKAATAMFNAVAGRITVTDNRGTASGGESILRPRKGGGTGRQRVSTVKVQSSIMGFFDRYVRIPYCRKTSFAMHNPAAYQACIPAIQQADAAFAAGHPVAYERQRQVAARTSRDFLIPGTTFTTVTLNKNFRTAGHRDAGDLPEGFGVMSYFATGRFGGGYLVFPAYRVALRLHTYDVVLFDAHEVHCNTALVPLGKSPYQRITCVHYYRANMVYCGDAAEELAIAKGHDPATPRRMKAQGRIHLDAKG